MGELAVLVDEKVYKSWFTIADSGAPQLRSMFGRAVCAARRAARTELTRLAWTLLRRRAPRADHDGRITGADAVRFFQRSGLPRETLSRVRAHKRRGETPAAPTRAHAPPAPPKVWVIADNARQGFLGYAEFVKARAAAPLRAALESVRSALTQRCGCRLCAPSRARSRSRS